MATHLELFGAELVTLDLKASNKKGHQQVDITNFDDLLTVQGEFEHVIHLAARPGIKYVEANPEEAYRVNVLGTQNMIKFCEDRNIPNFLYASSSSVYSDALDGPYKEDHPIAPKSVYSEHKRINELDARQSNIPNTTGMRFFTVYGSNGRRDMAYYVFAENARNNRQSVITGLDTSRDFTHVSTVCHAVEALLGTLVGHQTINICSNEPKTLGELGQHIYNFYGVPFDPVLEELPSWSVASTHGDNSLIHNLGVDATPFKVGLDEFLNWHEQISSR